MTLATLISAVILATSVTASPLVNERADRSPAVAIEASLSLKSHLNTNGDLKALVKSDIARMKGYLSHHQAKTPNNAASVFASVPLSNIGPLLTAEIGVGSPPTTYDVIVDTGSSNTFVGANKKYTQTSSSKNTNNPVSVSYGSGSFQGTEFLDTVTLGRLSIDAQSIGVAENSTGFEDLGVDGILGLGPDDLTEETVQNTQNVPTVTDNLAKQGKVPKALMGLFVPPANVKNSSASIDFGTPDSSKFNDEIKYVPITQSDPSSEFWGIDQSINYGSDHTPILRSTAGIVDSGTTLMFIASDAFDAYMKATGATQDPETGLLRVDSVDNLQSLFYKIGDNVFEFTANAQIWPRSLNSAMGGDPNATYLIVASTGAPSGQGLDFINGFTFLQRFYSVFDTDNKQVGFATTAFTDSTTN